MFNKKIDVNKVNEVTSLASKVLKILYFLLAILACYVVVIIFKETKIMNFLKTVFHILEPLFIGLVFAWLFDPFVGMLEKKGIKRVFGAIITYAILFLILFLVLSSLIPLMVSQVRDFMYSLPSIFNTIKEWVVSGFKLISNNDLVDAEKLKGDFFSYIEGVISNITVEMPQNFLGFISGLFSGTLNFLLGLIIGLFLIVNFDSSAKLFKFVPFKFRDGLVKVLDEINVSLRNYVKGALIDCTMIFILSSIGLWMCGLKSPALFGLFCGLTNIIPYAGPYIGGAPAVIVGFTQDIWTGIFVLIVIFVIQFLEGNFLQPFIMSKTTRLHPVTIILGLLVFGHFFGVVGMLISTPVLAALKIIIKFFNERYEFIKESHEV